MKSLLSLFYILKKNHNYNWYTDTQRQWWLANDQDPDTMYEESIRGMSDIQDLKMS